MIRVRWQCVELLIFFRRTTFYAILWALRRLRWMLKTLRWLLRLEGLRGADLSEGALVMWKWEMIAGIIESRWSVGIWRLMVVCAWRGCWNVSFDRRMNGRWKIGCVVVIWREWGGIGKIMARHVSIATSIARIWWHCTLLWRLLNHQTMLWTWHTENKPIVGRRWRWRWNTARDCFFITCRSSTRRCWHITIVSRWRRTSQIILRAHQRTCVLKYDRLCRQLSTKVTISIWWPSTCCLSVLSVVMMMTWGLRLKTAKMIAIDISILGRHFSADKNTPSTLFSCFDFFSRAEKIFLSLPLFSSFRGNYRFFLNFDFPLRFFYVLFILYIFILLLYLILFLITKFLISLWGFCDFAKKNCERKNFHGDFLFCWMKNFFALNF